MVSVRRLTSTVAVVVALVGCSTWESTEQGVVYTFSNHCGHDLTIETARGEDPVALPAGETRSVRTLDQEPSTAFVVVGPAGTEALHLIPGTSIVAIEGDRCPTDT